MPRYSYYRPRKSTSVLLPKHGRREVKAATSKEHEGEEIEVEVGMLSPKSCKSDASSKACGEFPSLMSNSSESLSGDEDVDDALEEEVVEEVVEERDDKAAAITSTSEEMRDDVSANDSADSALTNNSSRRNAVLSKRRAQAYLMAESVQRVQNRVGKTLLGALSVLSPTASVGKEVPNVEDKDDERFVEAEKDDLANMIEEQFKAHFDILNQNKHISALAASFDASDEKKELIVTKRECPMSPNSIDIRQIARMLLVLPPSQLRVESELSTEDYENNPELTVRVNESGSVSTNKSGDVDCLRQANKDLMETVKSLMAQNGDLSAQVEEVSVAYKTLKEINYVSEEKNEMLLDTVGRMTKSHGMEIDEIMTTKAECNELNKALEEVKTKYASEIEDCKAANQQLEHINADYASAIGNLASSLQESKDQNQSLKVRIEEVSAVNERLCDINSVNEKKSSVRKIEEMKKMLTVEKRKSRESEKTLEEVTAQMTTMMADQKETYEASIAHLYKSRDEAKKSLDKAMADIAHKSKLMEDKSAENASLSEQIQLSKNETDELMVELKALYDMSQTDSEGLKVALQELIVSNKDNIKQMTMLEEELTAKNSIIGGMTADNHHMSTLLEKKTVENVDLAEQLSLAKVKTDKLEAKVQALVASNKEKLASFQADYSKKLDIVTSTLEEIVEQNMALQGRVEEVSSVNFVTEEKNTKLVKELKQLEILLADEKHSHGNGDEMVSAIKVESDKLKIIVVNLRSRNTEYATEVENLSSSMQEMVERNETLQAQCEDFDETKKMLEFEKENNSAIIEKSQETLEAVTAEMSAMMSDQAAAYEENIAALGKSLNEVRSSLAEASMDINHKSSLLQTKSAEVVSLAGQLALSKVKIDELTTEVQAVVASEKEVTQQKIAQEVDILSSLENDLAAKTIVIDELTVNIQHKSSSLEEMSVEVVNLTEVLHIAKSKIEQLNDDAHELSADICSKKVSLEERVTEIAALTEQLQDSMVENSDLKSEVESLITSNKESIHQISLLEVDLSANETIVDEMTIDIQHKSRLLEEKLAEIAALNQQLQVTKVKSDGLKTEVGSLASSNNRNLQQISVLENDLVAKLTVIDTKSLSLEEKSAEIVNLTGKLELYRVKIDELTTEVQALIASKEEVVNQRATLQSDMAALLEDDSVAKNTMIDQLEADIGAWSIACKEKTAEIADLTEQLQLSKNESDGLKNDVKSLFASNEGIAQQMAVLKVDLAAKELTINETAISLEEKSEEIVNLAGQLALSRVMIDALEAEIQALIALKEGSSRKIKADINTWKTECKEKTLEISYLNERLQLSKDKVDGLEELVEFLNTSNKKSSKQVIMLEEDFASKMSMIDGMSADIQEKKSLLEEKSAEIADLTERLQQTKAESDRLETEIGALTPRNVDNQYQISVLEDDLAAKRNTINEITADVQNKSLALEEKISEITCLTEQLELSMDKVEASEQQIRMLEEDLASKMSMIDGMSADIKQKNILLDRKTAEILDLTELLQQTKAESDGLKTEVGALTPRNADNLNQIFSLEHNLSANKIALDEMREEIQHKTALIDGKMVEVIDLTEQVKLFKAGSDTLKLEVEALLSSKEKTSKQMSLLEFDLENKTIAIDEMSEDIQHKNILLDGNTEEIANLTEQLQRFKNESDGLKSKIEVMINMGEEHVRRISVLEDDLAANTTTIDTMSNDIQQKSVTLEEKSAEIADLTERLQMNNVDCEDLKTEVKSLNDINKENSNQISLLDVELAAKRNTIDQMTAEIELKSFALEEKITEIIHLTEQLELSKDKVEAIVTINDANAQKITMLEDDLANKTFVIDEMSEDIQYKNMLLDGKTAEIAHLTDHIETSKNKSDELKSKIEVMINMNKEDVQRISKLEDDLLAKSTLMSNDIQNKNRAFEEKLSEITDLTEQLKLSKAENDGLKTEVESLIAINKQNSLEISALEDDFATKKGMIDEMITYINKCNTNCEEMAAETTAQNKKLALSQQECDLLKVTVRDLESLISTKSSEIENLLMSVCDINGENEKLQAQIKQAYASIEVLDLSMKKMLTLEKEEKAAIVRKSEETLEEIKIKLSTVSGQKEALEEEVSNLSKSLVEMSFNSNQAKLLLEDKAAELTDLTDQLRLSIAKNDELDLNVKTLVVSNSEKVQVIADLTKTVTYQESVIEELSDVKNAKIALNEQVEVLTAESHILKKTIECLETKSQSDTNELKELESCLQERATKNEMLQAQVEEVSATNDKLIEINKANEEKIADSVDAVRRMTKSLKDDLAAKKVMIDELSKMLDKEREFSVAVVKKLEDTLEDVTTQITDQMSAQKESEVTISNLTKSLDDAQVDSNNKTLELEKKTAENVELSDRLHQSKTKFYELKSDVEILIARNRENLQVITELEDDVASKKCTIDDLTKAIGKYTGEIEHLKSCLQETVHTKDELHDMAEQLSSANEKLGKINIAYEGKNAILLDAIERLEESLNNERSSHETEKANNVTTVQNLEETITNVKVKMLEQKRLLEGSIADLTNSLSEAMALLDEKTAENNTVGEQLQLFTAKFDAEVTAKQTMIDEMSIDAHKRNSAYEELAAANVALNEQYELSEAECAQLMTTIECLESKMNTNANELENLTSSFQEVVETCDEMAEENNALNEHLCQSKASLQEVIDQNKSLLLQVDELGVTKDKLNDEKLNLTKMLEVEKENNATIIRNLKETLEAEKTQMTNQISAQKESLHKSIADLGKSLDEAMGLLEEKIAENLKLTELIENKDKELCKKASEVNNLNEQLRVSKKDSLDTIKMLKKEHKSMIFELKAAIQDLVSSTTMKNQHIKAMEEAKAVTKIMIDGLSEDIKNRDTRCEEMAKEITNLSERLELAKTECTDLGLKHTFQASEIETLMNSLQEMVDLNCSLQTQVESAYASIEELHEVSNANEEENKVLSSVVERVSQQLKDEKTRHERELKQLAKKLGSSHGREIEEMKKRLAEEKENNSIVVQHLTETLEDATTQLTLQMSIKQRSLDASIADLAKFLDK